MEMIAVPSNAAISSTQPLPGAGRARHHVTVAGLPEHVEHTQHLLPPALAGEQEPLLGQDLAVGTQVALDVAGAGLHRSDVEYDGVRQRVPSPGSPN